VFSHTVLCEFSNITKDFGDFFLNETGDKSFRFVH
jgi:hypothetical protein